MSIDRECSSVHFNQRVRTLLDDSSSGEDSDYEHPMYSPLSDISDHNCPDFNMENDKESDYETLVHDAVSDDSTIDEQEKISSEPLEQSLLTRSSLAVTNEEREGALTTEEIHYGYKLVGDNVDKNVKPSFQRLEMRGQSLHHFHFYGVKDRVPAVFLSDVTPLRCLPESDKLLPSLDDLESVKKDMSILLSRYVPACFEYYVK